MEEEREEVSYHTMGEWSSVVSSQVANDSHSDGDPPGIL